MSKLGYAVKRAMKMDWKKMRQTADMLHEKTGKSRAWLMQDMLRCALRYNAGYMDYKIAAMYNLNDAQRRTVITRGISNNIVRRMNDKAYWHYFDDKTTFNTLFAPYIGRKWIKVDDSLTVDALAEFLSDLPAVLFKPLEGSSGVGIVKYNKADWEKDIPAFLNSLRGQGAGLLEELLVQHPEMSRLCPTSVNTVRIATLLGDKREGVVYAFLRIGNGKVMENADQGGMAARVDLATGKLLTVAADKAGNVYDKHPITGTPIVGLHHSRIPRSHGYVPAGHAQGAAGALCGLGCGYYGRRPALYRGQFLPQPRCAAVCGALSRWHWYFAGVPQVYRYLIPSL